MSLRPCRECERAISTEATACPHCGAPDPTREPVSKRPEPQRVVVATEPSSLLHREVSPWWALGVAVAVVFAAIVFAADDDGRVRTPASSPTSPAANNTRAPRYERYVHSTTNMRAGPGTGFVVVGQAHRHEPLWVGVADSTGWTAVYASQASNDTTGFMLARLVHVDARTPAEIARAQAEERRKVAAELEDGYLDQGMDVRVRVNGPQSTHLTIEWILVSRVLAHQMSQEPTLFTRLRRLGFKKLIITDGYGGSWYWDL